MNEPFRTFWHSKNWTLPFLLATTAALAVITFAPETASDCRVCSAMTADGERAVTEAVNGPNLNRLGTREPEIYGTTTLTR